MEVDRKNRDVNGDLGQKKITADYFWKILSACQRYQLDDLETKMN
jgi:hypothetical protein